MSECPVCKGPMKPLFTGSYCPKDCDRPNVKAAGLYKAIAEAQDIAAVPRTWTPFSNPWTGVPSTPKASIALADDECRDFFCNGKGKYTHVSKYQTTEDHHFQCGICAKTWFVTKPLVPLTKGTTIP